MTVWAKRADMIVHEDEPFNAEPGRRGLAGSARTPIDAFYSRNHGPIPDIGRGEWRLVVDGLVNDPVTLSLAQLQRDFEAHTVEATLQCAGNRRAGFLGVRDIPGEDPWGATATSNAVWTGVRLADVLARAGCRPDAAHVEVHAPDRSELADPPQNYGSSVPLSKAIGDEVLLAWQMNEQPLPRVHGGPVRVVVPGFIGARSVKWLERITVRDSPSDNYFQAVAYRVLPPDADPDTAGPSDGISLGPVALNCDFLTPDGASILAPGEHEIAGYAFAGEDRAVTRVDVSFDGGLSWTQADVDRPASPWAWQHWRTTATLSASTTLMARAWDSTGALQPQSAADLWNPKGYVNNSWAALDIVISAQPRW